MDGRARARPLLLPADAVPRRPPAEPAVAVGGLAVHDRAGGGHRRRGVPAGAFPPGLRTWDRSRTRSAPRPGLCSSSRWSTPPPGSSSWGCTGRGRLTAGPAAPLPGVERQQFKWVAYAGVLLIGSFLLVSLLEGREIAAPVQLAVGHQPELGGRCGDPGCGGAVPAAPSPCPAGRRPALQPPPLRPGLPGALVHLAPRGRDGPYSASRAWRCWIQRRRPAAFDW
jgi:hypothetical protein